MKINRKYIKWETAFSLLYLANLKLLYVTCLNIVLNYKTITIAKLVFQISTVSSHLLFGFSSLI